MNIDLLCVTGSHLYGVANETSDLDKRGFAFDRDSIFNIKEAGGHWEQREDKNEDTVVYNLSKFISLLINGNTQVLETLYSNKIEVCTEIGQTILDNRNLFLSKKYYRSLKGFAFAEYKKAKCVKEIVEHESASAIDKGLHLITSSLNFKRFERNEITRLIEELAGQTLIKEVNNAKDLGTERLSLYEKYGFDIKSGYHSIRLLSQGIELFKTGKLTFPRPEKDILIQIRSGGMTIDEWEVLYKNVLQSFEDAIKESILPDRPDIKKINELWLSFINKSTHPEHTRT